MLSEHDLIERIKQVIKKNGITYSDITSATSLTKDKVSRLLNHKRRLTPYDIQQLCIMLQIRIGYLFGEVPAERPAEVQADLTISNEPPLLPYVEPDDEPTIEPDDADKFRTHLPEPQPAITIPPPQLPMPLLPSMINTNETTQKIYDSLREYPKYCDSFHAERCNVATKLVEYCRKVLGIPPINRRGIFRGEGCQENH